MSAESEASAVSMRRATARSTNITNPASRYYAVPYTSGVHQPGTPLALAVDSHRTIGVCRPRPSRLAARERRRAALGKVVMPVVPRPSSILFTIVLAACTVLGSAAPARAQSATGSVEGTIVDQSGALLPGVTVTLVEADTGAQRVTLSDADGHFAALLLPVGVYNLTAELAGFVSQKQSEVKVTIGQAIALRLQMSVGGVAESVTVSGVTPIIETGRSQVSSTVDETAVQNLPVNGRNFIDFALLTPGVTRDTRTGDISFAGQRGTLNSVVIDGADNNNTFFGQTSGRTGSGRAPYQFSQDAVKEFQVNSNSFSAEYGRAGGAVINVVTKSGTNELHGSAFEFYRDKALNANNAINVLNNRSKSPYHYNQFGGTAGGPIRRNKDFFFLNYDGQRNTQPNIVFLNLPATTPTD